MENNLFLLLSAPPQKQLINIGITLSGIIIIVLVTLFFQRQQTKRAIIPFPSVGNPQTLDVRETLLQGTKQYPNSPWILPLPDPVVIIPTWAANEVKSLPESKISLNKEIYIRMLGRFTMLGEDDDEMVAVIKHDLTRSIPNLFDVLTDEAKFGLKQVIGNRDDWKSKERLVSVYDSVARIVALISGRVFVGLPLSRDDQWLHSSITYTSEGVVVAENPSFKSQSAIMRYLTAPFLPQVRSLKRHQTFVKNKVKPLIDAHLKARETSIRQSKSSSTGKFLDWLLARYNYRVSAARIGRDYLLAAAGAIPIASGLLTQVLFELAARPEYIQILRKELEIVTQKRGWTFSCLADLDHMDSFMKETQRMNPHVLTMMPRRIMSPITLSDGCVLPAGISVAVSNHTINTSPDLYPNPFEFQGDRFYNLRKLNLEKNGSKYQFSTSTLEFMNFGYGTHTCPGRTFASAEMKICIAYILSNYELTLGPQGKPENITFGIVQVPDPTAKLHFESRIPIPGLEI